MPLPLFVQAIPYIASGLMAGKSLLGGNPGDKAAGQSSQDLMKLLQSIP
jgi:hypothetical protein